MVFFSKKISFFKKIFPLIFVITFSCFNATNKIWHPYDYQEKFESFYYTADHSHVVFLGKKFHYIFNDFNENLERILSLNSSVIFIDDEESFINLNDHNKIYGHFKFDIFNEKLNPDLEYYLHNLGFVKNKDGMSKILKINGTRFRTNHTFQNYNFPDLGQDYLIKIHVKLSATYDIFATALTPLTITLDGALALGKALLKCFDD